MSLENLNLALPKDVLPFMIEGEKWLSSMHFLTLLQNSGAIWFFIRTLYLVVAMKPLRF